MDKAIAAISTPHGNGGIAVIRISGEDAIDIANRIFRGADLKSASSHTVHYGHIVDENGDVIDEVLLTLMRAPRTFTREDVVEISTHGGIASPKRVLEEVIRAGAALAQPGEFTKRAFLNGRIDLAQAEAVIDVINSKTESAQKNAQNQLEGMLSRQINLLRDRLISMAAHMQVAIDYPDEELEDITIGDIRKITQECMAETDALLAGSEKGRILRDGIATAIAGRPNVGKSSLLNYLAKEERAIVTDIAGTTRDTIEEFVNIGGIPIRLTDTAGIRQTEDTVEKIGVEKSRRSIDEADLVLVLVDGSRAPDSEDYEIIDATEGKKRIILVSKSDIGDEACAAAIREYISDSAVIGISVRSGEGMLELEDEIRAMYDMGSISQSDGAVVTNMRHKQSLIRAKEAMVRIVGAIDDGVPQDILTIDINEAVNALGEITGASVTDDIVDKIFHEFCVGK